MNIQQSIYNKAQKNLGTQDLKIFTDAAPTLKKLGANCSSCGRPIVDHPSMPNYHRPSIDQDCPFRFVDPTT